MRYLFLVLIFANIASASNFLEENVTKLDWNGVEVVWLKNDTLPLYEMKVYFSDGALGDKKNKTGETQMMLDQLLSGTLQYNQKQIADIFEFYGSEFDTRVTHEYSALTISGMAKDAIPTVKMMCHLFSNATFPKKTLKSYQLRLKTGLKNLVNNKSGLADRVFRQVSLKKTQYSHPVSGTLKSISKIKGADLIKRLSFFNSSVKKRIYISGPESIKSLKKVLAKDCNWKGTSDFVRKSKKFNIKTSSKRPTINFLPISKANQAQIRIGRVLKPNNKQDEREFVSFAANFLGGGFTSRLMQELRVKRGLTYGASSVAAYQRDYGRGIITTFTKNKTITETLSVIQDVVKGLEKKEFTDKELAVKKKFATGQHLFSFENSSAILAQLMHLDHIKRPYSVIYDYPSIIKKINRDILASDISKIFSWSDQTVVVVGSPSIERDLRKLGKVSVLKLKDFL